MLPEPLTQVRNGKTVPVTTFEEWKEKREWIKSEYLEWISGHAPPAPKDFKVEILSDAVERKTRLQMIRLRFGPEYKGTLTLERMEIFFRTWQTTAERFSCSHAASHC